MSRLSLPLRRALALLVLVAAPIASQPTAATLHVRADNDAFAFWIYPWDRADAEYTSGVRATLELPTRGVARLLHREVADCAAATTDTLPCARLALALTHDIYTPTQQFQDSFLSKTERAYAGWARASVASRVVSPRDLDEREVTVGLLGQGALGRELQQFFHDRAPRYNRPRYGWGTQMRNAPTLDLAMRRARVIARTGGRGLTADLTPQGHASLGLGRTAATAALTARVGRTLTAPWLVGATPGAPGWEWHLYATGRATVVAHDVTLDGALGRDDPRAVGHLPFVSGHELGLVVRIRHFTAGYRASVQTREYRDGPVSTEIGVLETAISLPFWGRR